MSTTQRNMKKENKHALEFLFSDNKNSNGNLSDFDDDSNMVANANYISSTFEGEEIPHADPIKVDAYYDEEVDSNLAEEEESPSPILEDLAAWVVKYNISTTSGNDLLRILRREIPGLPRDARTLLRPPINSAIEFAIKSAVSEACQKIVAKVERRNKLVSMSLLKEIHAMRKEMSVMKSTGAPSSAIQPTVLPKKPFTNLEDFMEYDAEMAIDAEKESALRTDLKNISNSNSKKFVTTAWRKFLTDETAQKLCWRGTNEKQAARELTVAMSIRHVFMSDNGGSEDDFVNASKSFFQFAKSRQLRRTLEC